MKLRDIYPDAFRKMQRIAAAKDVPGDLTLPVVPVNMIEAAAAPDGSPKLPRYTMTAYTGVAMNLEGWYHPVVIDLAGMQVPPEGGQIPNFLLHSPSDIVGHAETWEVTQKTLKLAGVISGTGKAAQEVVGNAGNGFKWKASVGCAVLQAEFIESGASAKANGMNFKGPIYVARSTVLSEVSFVPIGADSRTSTKVAAKAAEAKFHHWQTANAAAKFGLWLDAQMA